MDLGHIFASLGIGGAFTAIGGFIYWLRQVLGLTKELETTKTAQDAFGAGQRLLRLPNAPKRPDQDEQSQSGPIDAQEIERARAAADLLRSYIPFGFLEYLLWATRAVVLVTVMLKLLDFFARRYPPKPQP